MQVTAVDLMAEIIQRYKLCPFNKMGAPRLDKAKVVVATCQAVHGFDLNNYTTPIFTSAAPINETIYSMTTFSTPAGNRIAFTTSQGQIYVIDNQGILIERTQISHAPIWSITQTQVGQLTLLFATCADGTIRACDTKGRLLGTIETPGRVFSLSATEVEGQTLLLGGVQGENHVYVWHLQQMIQRRDAAPMTILRGGRKPAFATGFLQWYETLWLVHGCWDNYVYLYPWPMSNTHNPISPTLALESNNQIYPIKPLTIAGRPCLLAGTSQGELLVWQMNENPQDPPRHSIVEHFSARITCLTVYSLGQDRYLLTGDLSGKISVFQLTDANFPEIISSFTLRGDKILGVGIV